MVEVNSNISFYFVNEMQTTRRLIITTTLFIKKKGPLVVGNLKFFFLPLQPIQTTLSLTPATHPTHEHGQNSMNYHDEQSKIHLEVFSYDFGGKLGCLR